MKVKSIEKAIVTKSIGDKEILCFRGYIPCLAVGFPVTVWSTDDTDHCFRTSEVKKIGNKTSGTFVVKTENSTYIIREDRRV